MAEVLESGKQKESIGIKKVKSFYNKIFDDIAAFFTEKGVSKETAKYLLVPIVSVFLAVVIVTAAMYLIGFILVFLLPIVLSLFALIFGGVCSYISAICTALPNGGGDLLNAVVQPFKELWGSLNTNSLSGLTKISAQYPTRLIEFSRDFFVKNPFTALGNSLVNSVSILWSVMSRCVGALWDVLCNLWNALRYGLGQIYTWGQNLLVNKIKNPCSGSIFPMDNSKGFWDRVYRIADRFKFVRQIKQRFGLD